MILIIVTRLLREKAHSNLIKDLRRITKPYGSLRALSHKSGVEYSTLHLLRKNGTATKQTIEKVTKALKA